MSTESDRGSEVRGADRDPASTLDPDSSIKPESPPDLHKRSWLYVGRKVMREFSRDQLTDQAAALTYYSVLAIFPAALALTSILGLVDQSEQAIDTVMDVLAPIVAPSTLTALEGPLRDLASSQAAGFALVTGLVGALWSASGYVGAFGRAMNRIYEIDEGRPFWKLRPIMLVITLLAVLMSATVLVMLVVSGPLARSIGETLGLGESVVTLWSIAKWPVLGLLVVLVVAMLYYATPNVKQPKFRWISVGAGIAIVVWVLASVGFAFYVSHFSSYDRTYGSLAGVIVTLLWLWITNLALLFGAEVDAELERGRELQAGLPAEEELQLPARDTRNIEKQQKKEQEDIELGRRIREAADTDGRDDDQSDDPPGASGTGGSGTGSETGRGPSGDAPEHGLSARRDAAAPVVVPVQGRHRANPAPEHREATGPGTAGPGPTGFGWAQASGSGVDDDRAGRIPVIAAGAAGFALGTTFGRMTRKESE